MGSIAGTSNTSALYGTPDTSALYGTPDYNLGATRGSGTPQVQKPVGYFWRGADGNVYVQGDKGINAAGPWDDNSVSYWGSRGFVRTADSPNSQGTTLNNSTTIPNNIGGGSQKFQPLDQAQISSLQAILGNLDTNRANAKTLASLARDSQRKEKEEELAREQAKYDAKRQTIAQDYGDARTSTDINARDTLASLLSSLSTLGMGGGSELTRQIIAAANQANSRANTTQSQNNQSLDQAFNTYKSVTLMTSAR